MRASMAGTISRLRRLVGDTAGEPEFSDDEIQDVLDRNSANVRYGAMMPEPIAGTSWRIFYSDSDFEDDAEVTGPNYQVLTLDPETDFATGRVVLADPISSIPVLISGRRFDVNAAGADLLEAWAAKAATATDFSADGASFSRSQASAALRLAAKDLRRRSEPETAALRTNDNVL